MINISLKHLMLAMFNKNAMYGYELKLMYDYLLVVNEALNLGQIYSTIARLERDNLVECVKTENGDKKVYTITHLGRQELTRWICEDEKYNPYPDNLSCKLAAYSLIDKDILVESMKSYRKSLIIKMQELVSVQRKLLPPQQGASLVIERNIYRLEADINWLALCIDKLQSEEFEC